MEFRSQLPPEALLALLDREAGHARTVAQFCERNNMCKAHFYNLLKAGFGPRTMKVGSRRMITPEAEADWRREREAAAAREQQAAKAERAA
jgi:hypothetical protein